MSMMYSIFHGNVIQITTKCNEQNTELVFSLRKKCILDDVKYIKQITDGRLENFVSNEHTSHLELQLGDRKVEICTKSLMINVCNDQLNMIEQNGLIFIFSKLFDLYIKRSISIKNIDITSIVEQAALDNADSLCLLFGITNPNANRSRTVDSPSSFSLNSSFLPFRLAIVPNMMNSKSEKSKLCDQLFLLFVQSMAIVVWSLSNRI